MVRLGVTVDSETYGFPDPVVQALADSPIFGGRVDQAVAEGASRSAGGWVTVDNLPSSGIVSAHRSGGPTNFAAVAPEGTIQGGWTSLALGAHILDIDYRTTADGTMVVMHDATVDRTTTGKGAVADHVVSALPNVSNRYTGSGWPEEPVCTLEHYLRTFGGKCVITIEAKEGVPAVEPLAALIKRFGLERSVFINTDQLAVIDEILANGCLAHLWAWNDDQKAVDGIGRGAHLIEIAYDSAPSMVAQFTAAVADEGKNLRWFIAGPISTREQASQVTQGIMGHVSDALGMTNRSGDARLVDSIVPSLRANKRGLGWLVSSEVDGSELDIRNGGIQGPNATNVVNAKTVYLGDMSGAPGATYTVRVSFVAGAAMSGTNSSVRLRVACELEGKTAQDSDTDGYVVAFRGTGERIMWKSSGDFGTGIQLGRDNNSNSLVAGREYSMDVQVTATHVNVIVNGAAVVSVADTTFRGPHLYLWLHGDMGGTRVTEVRFL